MGLNLSYVGFFLHINMGRLTQDFSAYHIIKQEGSGESVHMGTGLSLHFWHALQRIDVDEDSNQKLDLQPGWMH